MTGVLEGRVALVTGGGAGIGEGIARRYADEGARVVIVDRGSGQRVAADIGGLHLTIDVGVREEIEGAVARTVAEFGRIDILVNNAWSGITIGRVENKSDEQMDAVFRLAYYGPFWAMRAAFPHMRSQSWGRIINMGSLNGVNAHMGTVDYNSAKEALRALTRTAAREWARTGVTVNTICPAAKSRAFARTAAANPEIEAAADQANPMGRMGDPYDDIAPVAVFLGSDASRYLTGNTLFVDGGAHINGVSWTPNLEA